MHTLYDVGQFWYHLLARKQYCIFEVFYLMVF